MKPEWKFAVAGGLFGAFVAVAIVFVTASAGLLPVNGNAIRDYLMAHPDIAVDMAEKAQSQQDADADATRQKAIDRLGEKVFFDPRFAFLTGPTNAKTRLVEFFDYNCPFCRESIPAMKKFYAQHKNDTRFAFIEFPIKGPQSTLAARAALAARNQPDKYIAFHFLLMSEDDLVDQNILEADAKKAGLDWARLQSDMKAPGIDAAIAKSHALADAAKIDGTPVFIVNGKIREGAVDDAMLAQMAKS
jgi:protein-disulfide isomerase